MRVIILIIFLKIVITQNLIAQTDENLVKSLKEHNDQVSSVAFSPDGKQFISGSADKQIIIWDFETFQPLKSFSAIMLQFMICNIFQTINILPAQAINQ